MKILITGGTGSIGQAITKQLLDWGNEFSYCPPEYQFDALYECTLRTIRIYSRGEDLQLRMAEDFKDSRLRFLIGDVRDRNRLQRALNGVDMVIHCAALKQVPACEYNPIEAIRTNIDGSINVIDCAIDNHVKKVLCVSSDKAVNPISLYGATKLVQEKLFIQANVYGETKFSCVRLGNVFGSRGSFIQSWAKQMDKGEIEVTDMGMTRYWMTQESAAKFIIDSLFRMEGKEIFIPKIPQIALSEIIKEVAPDAKIKIIGKRPGEKMSEVLWSEDETPIDKGDYYVCS